MFRRVCENQSGNEILWLALKDRDIIAGALFFYWGKHAVYWHGAASDRHFGLRPNNLLQWEIIKDAARKGYGRFDFNPSGGYAGVEAFKDRFGAARVPSPVLKTRTAFRAALAPMRSLSLR
jgi:lipid II:glycine glycyltransferase (peptidoglycan interpeptide bridge formation enzyme)